MKTRRFLLLSGLLLSSFICLSGIFRSARACDTCEVFTARQTTGQSAAGFFGGVVQQYTHYDEMQIGEQKVFDPIGQKLDSSITQPYLGYNFTDRIGAQLNLPVIYRSWIRPYGGFIQQGSISGIGDLSLIGTFEPLRLMSPDYLLTFNLEGGVKFPTGDTTELKRDIYSGGCGSGNTGAPVTRGIGGRIGNHVPGGGSSPCGGNIVNAVPGSEISPGSGSYDAILGGQGFASFKRLYLQTVFHYIVRTRSDFGFEYRDDLNWRVIPGFYLLLSDSYSLAVEVLSRGYWNDEVYAGPGVRASYKFVSFQTGAELPVYYNADGLQLAPDYRINAALTFHMPNTFWKH